MQSINQDIKTGEFRPVYLLYGEEAYLRKNYRDKLKNALSGPEDSLNYTYFEGKGINPLEIIDLAETMPFLTERRLIIIENSGFFKNACDSLADYISEIPQTTHLVFVEGEVDKRGRLYKVVKDKGRAVEMAMQDESTLKKWILTILKNEGKIIKTSTMELFLEKTGTDMSNIRQEMEKLVCYVADREEITGEDVEAVCTTRITNKIFDMINAIGEKKQALALDLYYDLLALKEPPMRILFLISRQFNLFLQVRELLKTTQDTRKIAEKTGLQSFIVNRYIAAARRFGPEILRKALEDCVDAEEAVKTGRLNDMLSVEILIVKYTGQ